MSKKLISVIIPTCNRPDDLICVLKDLNLQSLKPDKIIIVDSSDNLLLENSHFLQNFYEFNSIETIFLSAKKGAALQRNVGISKTTGDLIFFLDDDMQVPSNYIKIMAEFLVKKPQYVGGMSAIKTNKPNKFNNFLRKIFLLQQQGESGKFKVSGMPVHPYFATQIKSVEVLNGCPVFKAEILKNFKFDENLGKYSYMEDCDLSYRISRNNLLFYNPEVELVHKISLKNRSSRLNNRAIYIYNYSYIFFKNFYPKHKFKIIFYFWAVLGLFCESIIYFDFDSIKGYLLGLKNFFVLKNNSFLN